MNSFDLMILGPATRDVNIDYTGVEDRSVGGAVTFCAAAAHALNPSVFAAVKIAPTDQDILYSIPLPSDQIALLPSAQTTLMRNEYFTPNRERRNATCAAQSDPILPSEVPDADCLLYHLAGLLYGDFPNELIRSLKNKGLLSADAQGFLRHNEDGRLVFHDWADKLRYLPYIDYLKTDAAEAEILTGFSDRETAARQLHAWGAGEVMISHNESMLVYDGETLATYPVRARNLSGRTGRGDTVFGAYLALRVSGMPMTEALRYATACVSLKMETPGPFRGTLADIEAYLHAFYADLTL